MRLPIISFSHLFLLFLSKLPLRNSLPTIDISSCNAKNTFEVRLNCYHAIDAALRKYGTFVAINHGIQPVYFEKSFAYADELFSLDIASKLGVSMSHYKDDFGRGYIPFGEEAGVSSYFEIKEGYSYGFPRKEVSDDSIKYNMMESLNRWPKQLSVSAREGLESVFIEKVRVARIIVEAIVAVQIELDKVLGKQNSVVAALTVAKVNDDLTNNLEVSSDGDTISLMRLFHYFPSIFDSEPEPLLDAELKLRDESFDLESCNNSDEKGQINSTSIMNKEKKTHIGSSPHTDWGLLTVIMQDEVGGLQFLHDNQWNDVPIIEHSLVINAGDYLNLISNGRYHSPIHRVLCPPKGKERTSFVFFYYPGFHSKISHSMSIREQVQFEKEKVHGQYNTLLYNEINSKIKNSTNDTDEMENDSSSFGDYILQKWKGVTVAVL